MDEFDETAQYANDYDDYQEEEEANGHDLDEEDVENEKMEEKLYDDDEEENPSEDEFEEEGILGLEKEQEDNIDDFAKTTPGAVKVAKKEPGQNNKFIPINKRKTIPIMTKFEYSYLISQRAMMIENDSPLMIPNTTFRDSIDIAKEETEKKVNPIILQRTLPNGMIEEWKCSELALTKNYVK